MKISLVFLAVLGISCALPAVNYRLKNDLEDFLNLIPTDKVLELAKKYENDPDAIKLLKYLNSKEFATVVEIVKDLPEVQEVVNYLESKDVAIKEFLNKLAEYLHLPGWGSYVKVHGHSTRNVRQFLDDLKAIIPVEDIVALALDKLANSPDFQGLFEMVSSIDANKMYDQAMQHPEFRDLISRINAMGINTKQVWEYIRSILGWDVYARRQTRHTYSLRNDLDDILALIPIEKMKDVVEQFKNDKDTQKIMAFVRSEKFAKVVTIISNAPEAQDLVNYLESEDLPVTEIMNKFFDRLGLPHWPGTFYGKSTYSFRQFLDEIEALLPINDIVAMALDKLANSPKFGTMFEKISSMDGPKLLEKAKTHPEVVDTLNFCRDLGMHLDKVWEAIKNIFGWE